MRNLLVLLIIILVCMGIASLLSIELWRFAGIDITTLGTSENLGYSERQILRIGLIINHLGIFLIPGIIFCKFFLTDDPWEFLRLREKLHIRSILIWSFVILMSYPFIAKVTEWNAMVPLADWMTSSQEANFALLRETLNMEYIGELILSLFLVGLLAALGEELIFRGIIQEYLSRHWDHPHLAIVVSSLIFGGFHMQFERILPLSILGLILGYSYHYTKSLMTPVILHFANNALQVVILYISTRNGEIPEIDNIPSVPMSIVLSSLLLTSVLGYIAIKNTPRPHESRP